MNPVVNGEKHFTASVWILTRSIPKKILLIHHKKFNKWMQPGGHIEKFENPIECAIREIKEETGIDIGFLRDKIFILPDGDKLLASPDFLVEQNIPPYKDTPQHFHLDMQYVVEVEEQELKLSEREAHGIGWFTGEEVFKLDIHENTKVALKKLL